MSYIQSQITRLFPMSLILINDLLPIGTMVPLEINNKKFLSTLEV